MFLKNINKEIDISITSRTPEIDSGYYEKVFPPLIFSPAIIDGKIKKILYFLKNLFQITYKKRLICGIKNSDLVISTGGGYFYNYNKFLPGFMFFQNITHVFVANLFKKPLIFFPQSFGPIKSKIGRKILGSVLNKKNIIKIFTREEISFKNLIDLTIKGLEEKVQLCPDMTFYFGDRNGNGKSNCDYNYSFSDSYLSDNDGNSNIGNNNNNNNGNNNNNNNGNNYNNNTGNDYKNKNQIKNPLIIITLRRWIFSKKNYNTEKMYMNSLKKFTELFLEKYHGKAVFYPHASGPGFFEDDRIITQDFLKYLGHAGGVCRINSLNIDEVKNSKKGIIYLDLNEPVDPSKAIQFISNFDAVIATRLHSAIFSMIAGVPVISISYQFKSKAIMDSMGLSQFEIGLSEIDPSNLLNLFEKILNNHDEIREKIMQGVCLTRKKLLKTIDFSRL